MSQVEEIRQRLLARRDELASRANLTDADLRHERDPLSADFEEQATQRENEDVLRGIGLAAKAELRHERDPLSADFEEQATQRENEDVLRGIGLAAKAELQDVNRALARLERGEYFDCETCGKPIATARLEALPETTRCARCAAAT